jgi:hypothetical protein
MHHRDALIDLLSECAVRAEREPTSLGVVLARLEQSSFALITLVLCLPFLQPVPLGPVAGLCATVLCVLGWQMMRGRSQPWLPARLHRVELSARSWRRLLAVCRTLIRLLKRFTRVRLTGWTDGPVGARRAGALICTGAVLLFLPIPIAPFTNSLPALGILCAAAAVLERDGLLVLISILWQIASVVYFALIVWVYFVLGSNAWGWMSG